MIRKIKTGIQVLQEIPEIKLYELNNLLLNYPIFQGLTYDNGKVYGILAEIGTK